MNTLWHKIWADLWLYKARTIPAVLSIAAGVFCVGTLFGMIDMQLSKMDFAHQQSHPAHINLILRNNTDEVILDRIKAIEGVSGIDVMTQLTIEYRMSAGSEWNMGTLMIRPETSKQRFDQTTLESGHWPEKNTLAIERMSAEFTGLHAGENIEIKTPSGAQSLAISGIVRHPFIKPPSFGGQVHFFTSPSNTKVFNIPNNTFRQLLVQVSQPYTTEKTHHVAHQIRTLLIKNNIAVNVTLLQNPEKHWGRQFLAGIHFVLQIMALTSLVLASILILNTLSAHISQQTEQIGIMKSLGAKTTTITALYSYEALLMAVIAIVLALPFSLSAAYFSSCTLLNFFNIDCGSFDYSSRAILYLLIGGLLAPLLAAWIPVIQGASMPVRKAISSRGLGFDFGSNRFDLWVERIGAYFLPTLYLAALGNLFRRKGHLLLTQSVLIIAGVMFMVLMSLISSINLTLDNEMARSRYTMRMGFSDDQSELSVTALAKSVAPMAKIEFWQRLPMEMSRKQIALRQKGSLGVQLLAIPSSTTLYSPLIEQGRWLKSIDTGKRVIILSADTAKLNGIEVGDKVDIQLGAQSKEWQVTGLYRWLAGSSYTVEPVYAPLDTVREMTNNYDKASFALLDASITTFAEEKKLVLKLKKKFQDNGIKLDVYNTIAKLQQRQLALNQFKPVLATLLGLACMIAVVGGVGLSGVLIISVLQRTREIGILFAIGAPDKAIFRLFIMEGLFHAILAWSISVPLTYLAAEPIAKMLGETMLAIQLDFVFKFSTIAYWLMIVVVIATIASYWPARKAAKMTVLDCLRH